MTSLIVAPKTFLTYSLGCRTNQAEIEKIGLQLTDYGLQQNEENPDLVLLNTCVVTQKAEKETRQKIRELRKKYPKSFLVILGCGPTARIVYPEADLLIGNEEKEKAVDIILMNLSVETFHGTSLRKTRNHFSNPYISSGRKFIKIQEGCDLFCSFCLTAYLRGKPKSVPIEKIIKEINFWVKNGIKEIVLTGINIALYRLSITELLKNILEKTQAERITLSSIYPEMLSDNFIKLVVNNPRTSQCFHLSLQSGSPTVLERMNRKYDPKKLKDYLLFIKKINPEFTFRADIIAGFPGETEEEFAETLEFIKKAKISFVHSFLFSARPGTKLERLIKSGKCQDLSNQIKKERARKIMEVVKTVQQEEAQTLINKRTNCLIVRGNEGITGNGWPIQISSKQQVVSSKGKIMPVKITGFENDQLWGEILSLPR